MIGPFGQSSSFLRPTFTGFPPESIQAQQQQAQELRGLASVSPTLRESVQQQSNLLNGRPSSAFPPESIQAQQQQAQILRELASASPELRQSVQQRSNLTSPPIQSDGSMEQLGQLFSQMMQSFQLMASTLLSRSQAPPESSVAVPGGGRIQDKLATILNQDTASSLFAKLPTLEPDSPQAIQAQAKIDAGLNKSNPKLASLFNEASMLEPDSPEAKKVQEQIRAEQDESDSDMPID